MSDISVSFSRAKYDKAVRNYKSFTPARGTFERIPNFITEKVWSPIVWKDGQREIKNFLAASVIAIDIDEGRTIEETKEFLTDYNLSFIIATSKSHQKEKVTPSGAVKPPCDRYRVVIETPEPVTDREVYQYNMTRLAEILGADKSCSDGARYFFPCVEVVEAHKGASHKWLPLPDDYVPEDVRFAKRREKLQAQGRAGILPGWILSILQGEEVTERHKTCYRIGCTLAAMGMNEAVINRTIAQLCKVKIGEIGPKDVERAVWNGVEKELGIKIRS